MILNVEYRHKNNFENFFLSVKEKRVAVMFDLNTKPFALPIIKELKDNGSMTVEIFFPAEELIPTKENCDSAYNLASTCDYLLAVGSGSLNDMAKYVSTLLSIPCGVLATAASMDGYCSKGAALMFDGVKVTKDVNTPKDVLIDLEIIRNAPKEMTASGFGDIVGKYTCLTDWEMTNAVKGEEINQKAFKMMEQARADCLNAYEDLTKYHPDAVAKLMDALIMAGLAMAECGNSRPASGSEHHISHYLEMDFVRRGEKVPLHGVKVAIGTLIAIELYNYLKDNKIKFNGCEKVYRLVEKLPTVKEIESMLVGMGCPIRFSQIGVRREVMEGAIEKAHTVRDRYTVLTLVNELGLTEKVKPILMEKFY